MTYNKHGQLFNHKHTEMKTRGKRIKDLERLVNNLEIRSNLAGGYEDRFDKLERRCWEIECPAEFKNADKVMFSEAKKGGYLFGVFRVIDVCCVESSRGSCLLYEWHYSILNMKTGVRRTCVTEYKLVKAK